MQMTAGQGSAALLALLVLGGCGHRAAVPAGMAETSQALAATFQARLQTQLKAALATGGPLLALDVCHAAAPAIAEELSRESGATIRRVSLRARNPDAHVEGVVREKLSELALAPVGPDGTPNSRSWTVGSGKAARVFYLQAIPMREQPCAACHGTAIAPDVKAKIAQLYPGDQATGFKPGELRGAIAINWPASAF